MLRWGPIPCFLLPRISGYPGIDLPPSGANRLRRSHIWRESCRSLDDRALRKRSLSLRFRAKSGEQLVRLVPEAFALVREAARRALTMRHFDVQMLGGIALFHGRIAEMDTGEGKTLTATLPMYVHALVGKGTHLATVNDYLAARDAESMGPVYEMLGLTVGVIQTPDSQDQRRRAYACDITYGTAKEFGFDFLRDRLLMRRMGRTQDDFLGDGSSQRWDDSGNNRFSARRTSPWWTRRTAS